MEDARIVRHTAGPSDEDWSLLRSHITQLYQTEDRSLEEVMQTMKGTFGFNARYVHALRQLSG